MKQIMKTITYISLTIGVSTNMSFAKIPKVVCKLSTEIKQEENGYTERYSPGHDIRLTVNNEILTNNREFTLKASLTPICNQSCDQFKLVTQLIHSNHAIKTYKNTSESINTIIIDEYSTGRVLKFTHRSGGKFGTAKCEVI